MTYKCCEKQIKGYWCDTHGFKTLDSEDKPKDPQLINLCKKCAGEPEIYYPFHREGCPNDHNPTPKKEECKHEWRKLGIDPWGTDCDVFCKNYGISMNYPTEKDFNHNWLHEEYEGCPKCKPKKEPIEELEIKFYDHIVDRPSYTVSGIEEKINQIIKRINGDQ